MFLQPCLGLLYPLQGICENVVLQHGEYCLCGLCFTTLLSAVATIMHLLYNVIVATWFTTS